MQIAHFEINPNSEPFIIAEMSGNHNQSLDRALEIVDAAATTGAHAIKIQTYTPDTMTLDIDEGEFFISDPSSMWKGQSMYQLYQKAYTPWEWHAPIIERAKAHGMLCFSTPFDESSVDFLESLDTPCYKIASFECVDLPLIRKAASTGKPLIISTGMATIQEIADAVAAAREGGCKQLALLKCTSNYPATPENTNIRTIPNLKEVFGCEAGLSDHTMGTGVAVASIALGATIIEKHFTLSRDDGGVDAAFSLEPHEFKQLVIETKRAWQSLGQIKYGPTQAEAKAVFRRRSLYIAEDLTCGETLSSKSLRRIRPGHGLPPKYYHQLIGKRVNRPVTKGTPVSWDLIG